jgi:UDP-2,4-diacetamido-2,4,6-trideoxy-beta-L-altropyranose hydrolase
MLHDASVKTNSSKKGELTVCFITDGGRQMGMGHVQQSITLARELQGKASIFFITKSNEIVLTVIRESGFAVVNLQNDIHVYDYLVNSNPNIIIFDKIDVDEELAKKIRTETSSRLIIFTNLTNANQYAHIAVLPRAEDLCVDPVSRFKNLTYTNKSTNTEYFFGPKYWILRREFFEYKKLKKSTPEITANILLTFGGSDSTNITCQVLKRILEIDCKYHIDIVLGQQFCFHNEVKAVLDIHREKRVNVSLHSNVKNMAELMYHSDLVVTAAGMTMFEALCVGTPIIVIPQDALQRDTYKGVVRLLEIDELGNLEKMILDADFTNSKDSNIIDMDIGLGLQELVDAILIQKDYEKNFIERTIA